MVYNTPFLLPWCHKSCKNTWRQKVPVQVTKGEQTHLKKSGNPKETILLEIPVSLNQQEPTEILWKEQILHFLDIQIKWKAFRNSQQWSKFKGEDTQYINYQFHKSKLVFLVYRKAHKKITRTNVGCPRTHSWKTSNQWDKFLIHILTPIDYFDHEKLPRVPEMEKHCTEIVCMHETDLWQWKVKTLQYNNNNDKKGRGVINILTKKKVQSLKDSENKLRFIHHKMSVH